MSHERYMRTALQLAQRNLGITWPNPSVGALIVRDGQIIAQGITAKGGRPHAETQALKDAGEKARGATMYVTLEPCSHQGQTPPCTHAIIDAGIRTVIISCKDTNPLVSGKGIALLHAAGIEIIEGVCEKEARALNQGFFSVVEKKRPFISLKLATSLDGKMATKTGESKWITGEKARQYGHMLRSRYDAIVTGIGTILADDPHLTCRLPGLEDRSPVRVVFDRHNRLPKQSNLAKTAQQVPVWIESAADLPSAVAHLTEQGITRLLVEAGPTLSTAFLQSGLVDRMYWFRAPVVIGEDGLAAADKGFSSVLSELNRWQPVELLLLQPDLLEIYECSLA